LLILPNQKFIAIEADMRRMFSN